MTEQPPADEPKLEYLHEHHGANRAERRAAKVVLPDGTVMRVPKDYVEQSINTPYVKDNDE